MLKEIKEEQQVTPTLLKRQPNDSQQKPVRHCGICSYNSQHTDECPQLQEDNAVASTHNFYDAATNPPYNRQYCTQGGRDNQPAHWIPPQQQQAQPRAAAKNCQPINHQPSGSSPTFKPITVSTSSKPQGGINAVRIEKEEDEVEDEDDENHWLYELLKKMANSDDEEDEKSEDESEEDDEDEST
ncbi:hypothetical protein PIB30_078798 [Stylosanthes scabra]|uniref:Uncharacterized protein n=1 Tax=Stylosanthes scabra TaxID=79078 RepID=A0ABU6RRT9_9FABA|nr:hypothetical protein [Stylosanthes scabra]